MIGILAVVTAALLAPVALAADNREIAADLADGRLDGTYTKAELEAYVRDAMVQGYGAPELPPPAVAGGEEGQIGGVAGVQRTQTQPQGQAGALGEEAEVGVLPFTGFDLALLAFGGALLLLLGFGARRLGRRQQR